MASQHPKPGAYAAPISASLGMDSRRSFDTPMGSRNDSNDAIPDEEKGQSDEEQPAPAEASYLVRFDGPNDPDNPKNWTAKRRWVRMSLKMYM